MPAKRKTTVAASRPSLNAYRAGTGDGAETVAAALIHSVRFASQAFATGDQIPPCVILWTDPQRQWEGVLEELKAALPELFVFGSYAPETRTGPAIWLRCVESRTVDPKPPANALPVFYLPGVSKQQLRAVEECPPELQPLVELQFRGVVWTHPNGKDWTPLGFLMQGLDLDVVRDEATGEALLRALPALLKENVADLRHERLDGKFFDALLSPDPSSKVLRWMNAPKESKARQTKDEWKAFCGQCVANLHFHPDKDGELTATKQLSQCQGEWAQIWKRFTEAPHRYPEVVRLLEQMPPPADGELALNRETCPAYNAQDEVALAKALLGLKSKRADEAAKIILDLEKIHRPRRDWVWKELGKAQLAVALEYLSLLATLVDKPLAAPSAEELGDMYAKTGWEVDAAVLAALGCCTSVDHEEPICNAVRSLYLQWLDESDRNLQNLKKQNPDSMKPRQGTVEIAEGRVVIFADGLRFDVAQRLAGALKKKQWGVDVAWDWTAFPSVTATAKPHASPIGGLLTGGEADDEFAVTVTATGQRLTQDRFEELLKNNGVEVLKANSESHPAGSGWIEVGALDKRGHSEGWKLAKTVDQEIQDLVIRIEGLLSAGWKEVFVVTDHGWLLMPGGLPKVELPRFLAEHRWGRCAAMKETAVTNLPLVPWHWNPQVSIASPPGIGCFKAGSEYVHGGISAQEMVVPRILVRSSQGAVGQARISEIKWIGLRCRVTVQNYISGMLADVRTRAADGGSSRIEGKKAKEVGTDGTVSLAIADDADQGSAAVVVLMTADGTIIQSQPTVIGENR